VASAALFMANCKLLPNQNRPSTHLQMFATLCLAAVLAYIVTPSLYTILHRLLKDMVVLHSACS